MVTNQEDDLSDEVPVESTPAYLIIFRYVFGTAMWLVIAVVVFRHLPKVRKVFEDFDTTLSPLSKFVLQYMGVTFVLIAVMATVTLTLTRSRESRWLILYGIPLALGVLLILTIGWPLLRLLNEIS